MRRLVLFFLSLCEKLKSTQTEQAKGVEIMPKRAYSLNFDFHCVWKFERLVSGIDMGVKHLEHLVVNVIVSVRNL